MEKIIKADYTIAKIFHLHIIFGSLDAVIRVVDDLLVVTLIQVKHPIFAVNHPLPPLLKKVLRDKDMRMAYRGLSFAALK